MYLQNILEYHCLDVVMWVESKIIVHVTLLQSSFVLNIPSLEWLLTGPFSEKILMIIIKGI